MSPGFKVTGLPLLLQLENSRPAVAQDVDWVIHPLAPPAKPHQRILGQDPELPQRHPSQYEVKST